MIETAGLKCAPLMGPRSAMSVASTATVAAVFANNATARFPPASRSAMIPEPITVEANSVDPRPSATSARRIMSDGTRRWCRSCRSHAAVFPASFDRATRSEDL
jgi:hypothetical protein